MVCTFEFSQENPKIFPRTDFPNSGKVFGIPPRHFHVAKSLRTTAVAGLASITRKDSETSHAGGCDRFKSAFNTSPARHSKMFCGDESNLARNLLVAAKLALAVRKKGR